MKKVSFILLSVLSVLLVACSNNQESTIPSNEASSHQSSTQENRPHRILVSINGQEYSATLNDSQASQSLLEQLPLEQSFRDFSASFDEKITDLEGALDFQTEQHNHDPQAGDIAYWSPDHRLVFYWGDVGEDSGIQVMGHFDDSRAIDAIRQLQQTDSIEIRRAG